MDSSGRDPRIAALAILVSVLSFTFAWVVASAPVAVMGAPCGSLVNPSSDALSSSELMLRCAKARGHNLTPSVILGIAGIVAITIAFDHRPGADQVDEELAELLAELRRPTDLGGDDSGDGDGDGSDRGGGDGHDDEDDDGEDDAAEGDDVALAEEVAAADTAPVHRVVRWQQLVDVEPAVRPVLNWEGAKAPEPVEGDLGIDADT